MERGRPLVTCVDLSPWPLTLLSRQHPGVPVAVLGETTRRVLHASPEALAAGVHPGLRDVAALSRCPDLHAEVVTLPTAAAAWNELLDLLYARSSDRVDGRTPGTALLKLSLAAARDLAAALHAPVGLAASVEVAQLAALRATPGEVRDVTGGEDEQAFLRLSRTEDLHVLGLTPAHAERLRFLGVRTLGDLWTWNAGQRAAFLGADVGQRVNRFLRGERTTSVARYAPSQVIGASLRPGAPVHEPGQASAVLAELIPGLHSELRGRTCAYLTLHADTLGGRLTATRKLKGPLDVRGLTHSAAQALADTDALPLGVDAFTVQLSGLARPSRLVGLWAGLAELDVTTDVLDRFPEALRRVEWLDPFAYAVDAQYRWVDWLTGAPCLSPMAPRRAWAPPSPAQAREQAVQRVLAFFAEERGA